MNGVLLLLWLTLTPQPPIVVADFPSIRDCRQAADKANNIPEVQSPEGKAAGAVFVCATVEAD